MGPTAAGKSAVAMIVAEAVGAQIISVDSMQVYRRMNIGTAKPTSEDQKRVRHRMVDVVDPSEAYSVAEFQRDARAVLDEGDGPLVVVGGSGLHFRALVDPLEFPPTHRDVRARLEALDRDTLRRKLVGADPTAGDHVDLGNPRRVVRALEVLELTGASPSERADSDLAQSVRGYIPKIPITVVGVDPGDLLRGRVASRFERMMKAGLLSEVAGLLGGWGVTASQAVGYREMARVVAGDWSEAKGRSRAIDATTALARRQRTYFRRDPRIKWLEWDDDPQTTAAEAFAAFKEAGWNS